LWLDVAGLFAAMSLPQVLSAMASARHYEAEVSAAVIKTEELTNKKTKLKIPSGLIGFYGGLMGSNGI
jgi:hypothetical protein